MNRLLTALLILSLLCIVPSCTEPRVYRIGVSQCSQDDWREKMNDEIEREAMFHEDALVEIRSADDSNEKQAADIRSFADRGFDIIIVSPNEAAALTPVIDEVFAKGIPVIIFDRNIKSDSYTARIGVDNVGLGRSAAHYALNLLGPSQPAIEIYGLPGSTPADDRHTGFAEEYERGGGLLKASAAGNWNKEDAVAVADSLLREHPETKLIYAHNDRMAIGASELAARLGRKDIRIIGIDAAPDIGIRAVADSVIDATFLYPTEGHRIIRLALDILRGKPYERETLLPVSSAVDLSNADILLLQDETLREETGKMRELKSRLDDYWAAHSSQTVLFYASIVIIVLLFGVVFLTLRTYWQHKRHQRALMDQNRELEAERDKARELNTKLEEVTRSKLMFYTNVSHDLRTPLSLISEPVAQLAGADNLTERQHTLMRIADKNVHILRRLINQILDFRKYENDKLELNLTETDLGKSVAEWVEGFKALTLKRALKLSYESIGNGSAAVDAEKFERVVFNLISNAIKYTPAGGTISVRLETTETEVRLSVADTGQGISERDLGRIFDRFYQVERIHPEGSGIGLSLCKAFVEMHGGRIEVQSREREGTVFTVTIPVRHVAEKAEAVGARIETADIEAELGSVETEPEMEEGKPLVLVIDDNQDIRTLVSELLKGDYNVLTARNGAEGIRKAVKYVPDLVICDIMMPVMDGLECCRRLKSEVTTSHIPVLMLTACGMDEQRSQGYDSGADGYLSKPFSAQLLSARCSALIANRRRIRELWLGGGKCAATQCERADAKNGLADLDSDFYRRFLEIFNREMSSPELSVDSLASKMGLERTQFYRKIKALTNFTPVELIRNLRLNRAQHLVKTTEKTFSEIAYEVGFSTPAYFTRCYREAFGETPSETRGRVGG